MQERHAAAPGALALLRRRHEREERLRQHAFARVRRQQSGTVCQTVVVQGCGPTSPQLRQPDALSGGCDRRQHGTGRNHPELSPGGRR